MVVVTSPPGPIRSGALEALSTVYRKHLSSGGSPANADARAAAEDVFLSVAAKPGNLEELSIVKVALAED